MRIEDVFFFHAFDLGCGAQNSIERADAKRIVVGNGQPMRTRGICFQNHVAAFLIDPAIAVMLAEQLD